MSGVEAMVAQATKSLGLGEPNYIQRWYPGLSGNFAWCDASISYWAWHSGNQDAVTFGGYYAFTVAHAEAFRKRIRWHTDTAGIKRGDIVFFDWGGSNTISRIDHVGLVTGVSGPNVLTIEGNTNNVCARRVRRANVIAGYGRPVYANSTPSRYVPFPGTVFFTAGRNSPIITAMGERLIAEGCGMYRVGPGPVWGEADRASYAKWQRMLGYAGDDANGIPGASSWAKLKVPA
jgi:hypothetical protein